MSHQNPKSFGSLDTKVMLAEKAYIGNFEIGEAVKEMFTGWTDVTSDTRPDDPYIKLHSGFYYHTEDLFDLQVGDVRLKFQFSGLEGDYYTVVGELRKGKIQPFISKMKKPILLLMKGELTIDEIFLQEHYTVKKKTWQVRFFGFMLLFFGVISTETLLRIICELHNIVN